MTKKPKLKLTGTDGNAFAILGAALRAAMKAKMPEDQWCAIRTKAMAGSYEQLLETLFEHFDVR